MSAAATAAGYLYASGRLRGRAQREQEEGHNEPTAPESRPEHPRPRFERPRAERPRIERPRVAQARPEVRVAALPPKEEKPRRTPVIQYRTRRWKPDE
ncbi:MAG: hypothetical protein JF611_04295 [Betaproteobacteria bacterium]|jgi:hypothetical protein|nr:hypothetical protein [Betaproteobacteria bacterium]